jgi:Acyl-CoA dehydrogenase, C-terminal domain
LLVVNEFHVTESGGFVTKTLHEMTSTEFQAVATAACTALGVDCSSAAVAIRKAEPVFGQADGKVYITGDVTKHDGEEWHGIYRAPDGYEICNAKLNYGGMSITGPSTFNTAIVRAGKDNGLGFYAVIPKHRISGQWVEATFVISYVKEGTTAQSKCAPTNSMNERLAVGDAPGPDFDDIFALARSLELDEGPAIRNPAVREKRADWYVKTVGLKYTKFRTMTALSRGQTPGPEASITKLVSASKLQEIASYGIDLMGMSGAVMDSEIAPMEAWFQEALLYAPGLRIAGGSDEILRNIIAERVLGMPGDIRPDKDVPFRELKSGKR